MKFKILYLIIIINFFILKNTILSQTTTNDFIGCNETEGKCTLTESCPVAVIKNNYINIDLISNKK